uniref:KPRS3 n=1 Tax=Arundo donax TaxID=35708 RepID=A0A0A9E3C0_ARUDO
MNKFGNPSANVLQEMERSSMSSFCATTCCASSRISSQ